MPPDLLSPSPPPDFSGAKLRTRLPADVAVSAVFSPCRRWRYKLVHRWEPGPLVLWALMNCSAASETVSDMTVSKTGRISRRLGFGGQIIVNSCAMCATDRMRLLDADDPVGPENHRHIVEAAAEAAMIVVAHGRLPGGLQRHADEMVRILSERGRALHVLRLSADGVPVHPLARGKGHVPEDVVPRLWEMEQ